MNFSRILPIVCIAAASASACAAPPLKVRIAAPSAGIASDDLIVFTADASDYGADRTGRKDSTGPIQSALDDCERAEGGTVFLPAGRYRVGGRLFVRGGVTVRGEWSDPDDGGLGKGTILMAFAGRGEEKPDGAAFLNVESGGCLRDISVWYPEQKPASPAPYPATIRGSGHSTVFNVTLYNSWTGFWNNSCSSMLARRIYGTPLRLGIHGAYAFDVPRIENVAFSPRFWAASGLPGAPSGETLHRLKSFLRKNLVCIQAGEQDWGYWWGLDLECCRKGLFLTAVPSDDGQKLIPGNICAGNVRIRDADVGVFVENAGYPGFMMTYGDVAARVCPLYFAGRPDYASRYGELGSRASYQDGSSLVVTDVAFRGGKYSVASAKKGHYGINLSGCAFSGYSKAAVRSADGSVSAVRSRFCERDRPAFELGDAVRQLVAAGNSFAGPRLVEGWSANDGRIVRDVGVKTTVPSVKYSFDHVARRRPDGTGVWDVCDFGAVRGEGGRPPSADSTDAFRKALAAAEKAHGGTVYAPAGTYRMDGALEIPPGVELRGSFEGQHYGNSTHRGTQLWVYGGKEDPHAAPFVTMRRGSGFKGFAVFYPEQGWTDATSASGDERVKAYPPTVRTAAGCWVQNCSIVGCSTAIDAMTERSDDLELIDVTGAALGAALEYGHGAKGGVVRDYHFNYSGWTHQPRFPNRPRAVEGPGSLTDYTTRFARGLVLGDLSACAFHSCFNILVGDQVVLERDRFTGGSFRGKMWGVAFDAAHNGVVGKDGSEAVVGLVASMGVFNQQGGGRYAVTEPGFRGRIVFSNADVWSGRSRVADVAGGSVAFSQLLSWCCMEAVCKAGGRLDVFAGTFVGDRIPDGDTRDCIRFEAGAKGSSIANLECRRRLRQTIDASADVAAAANGPGRAE